MDIEHLPDLPVGVKEAVIITHNESTFYSMREFKISGWRMGRRSYCPRARDSQTFKLDTIVDEFTEHREKEKNNLKIVDRRNFLHEFWYEKLIRFHSSSLSFETIMMCIVCIIW